MKSWREAATIIIAARNGRNHNHYYDYNILLLKRHSKANLANALVFPGGPIEPVDADLKWKNLFNRHGYGEDSFKSLYPNTSIRPSIYYNLKSELSREIFLRISAIRETFEECGILLCKSRTKTATSSEKPYFPISSKDLDFWQIEVHKDPKQFYNMCEKLECCPNLWALHEWGNWLSPALYEPSKRFNTAFYFTSLPHIPCTKFEASESTEILWETPENIMKLQDNLITHQKYEISRIAKCKYLRELIDLASAKSKKGAQLYYSVRKF